MMLHCLMAKHYLNSHYLFVVIRKIRSFIILRSELSFRFRKLFYRFFNIKAKNNKNISAIFDIAIIYNAKINKPTSNKLSYFDLNLFMTFLISSWQFNLIFVTSMISMMEISSLNKSLYF
jgi:hypothetical protein